MTMNAPPPPAEPQQTVPAKETSSPASPAMIKGLLWTNTLLVVLTLFFLGYLAKTVWLKEKTVWVLPCPAGSELATSEGQTLNGPELLPASTTITMSKPGFSEQSLALNTLDTVEPIAFIPAPGTVLLASTPSGAAVFYGGAKLGRTPVLLDSLPAGVHLLQVGGQDTRNKAVPVEVKKGKGTTENVQLDVITGTVLVVTTTPGCAITVDGATVGKVGNADGAPAPLTLKNMFPGTYTIRATTPDGKAKEARVTVGEQQHMQVSIAI